MLKNIFISLRMLFILTVLTGLIYPLLITGISLLFFKDKAGGSIIRINNKTIGSELIGQKFSNEKYFWGRPSSADYAAVPSGASNLSYTSTDLKKNIEDRKKVYQDDPGIPKELLFASASGIDPEISPEAARYQIDRVSKVRGFNEEEKNKLRNLVESSIIKRQFFILGEERVNVLLLNIELDKIRR